MAVSACQVTRPVCSLLQEMSVMIGKVQTWVRQDKKGLTGSSFLFSALKVLRLFQNAGTGTFLWVAFICNRYKFDLNFVFDDHFYSFVAVWATRGEWGLGIENGIFEDDPSAMRTIAYVFLSIHSCFSRGGLLPTRLVGFRSIGNRGSNVKERIMRHSGLGLRYPRS